MVVVVVTGGDLDVLVEGRMRRGGGWIGLSRKGEMVPYLKCR